MSTTFRIALLAGLLALVSNLAVISFIYFRTHDEADATLHQQVMEQGKVLADVYRSGGKPALDDAIRDTIVRGTILDCCSRKRPAPRRQSRPCSGPSSWRPMSPIIPTPEPRFTGSRAIDPQP